MRLPRKACQAFVRFEVRQLLAIQGDRAVGDPAGAGQESENRGADGRLAGARFTDQPVNLATFKS